MTTSGEYYRDLIVVLVAKDLKVRYRSTLLGYGWSVLHPLAFALVFYIVFKVFARIDIADYTLFLISGLFPWHWIQNSVSVATATFVGNSNLIKKVKFPRLLLVVATVLNDLVHFVFTIPVIALFVLWYHGMLSVSWLYEIPVMVATTFLVTVGLALLVATCNVFLRDIERLLSIIMMLWFYLTPILYKPEMVPEPYRWVHYVNPFATCIIAWRQVFLGEGLPLAAFGMSLVWGVVFFVAGYQVYRRLEWRFAEFV